MKNADKKKKDKIRLSIRSNVISGAEVYKKHLAGKHVIYVYNNTEYFILNFQIGSFMHLTGVGSKMKAEPFYKQCNNKTVSINDFIFNPAKNPISTAVKKSAKLNTLTDFINAQLLVLKDVETTNCTYPFVLTTIDSSLCMGLALYTNANGDQIYYPKSLRIGGDLFTKKNSGCYSVDFILSKKDIDGSYDTIHYQEQGKDLPAFVLYEQAEIL